MLEARAPAYPMFRGVGNPALYAQPGEAEVELAVSIIKKESPGSKGIQPGKLKRRQPLLRVPQQCTIDAPKIVHSLSVSVFSGCLIQPGLFEQPAQGEAGDLQQVERHAVLVNYPGWAGDMPANAIEN